MVCSQATQSLSLAALLTLLGRVFVLNCLGGVGSWAWPASDLPPQVDVLRPFRETPPPQKNPEWTPFIFPSQSLSLPSL